MCFFEPKDLINLDPGLPPDAICSVAAFQIPYLGGDGKNDVEDTTAASAEGMISRGQRDSFPSSEPIKAVSMG